MTISSETRKAGPFAGNGISTSFPFSFKVFGAQDVRVFRADAAGVETPLVLSSDYTVSLNADQDTNPGGTVALSGTLAPGHLLTITSALPNLQPTDITNMGGFYPRVVEDSLDRHTIQIQQLAEQLGRALKINISSPTSTRVELPSPLAGSVIGWDASAAGLTNYSADVLAASLVNAIVYGSWVYGAFVGDGVTTEFELESAPGSLANTDVAINGATQSPILDYTISNGTTLQFSAAPPVGAKILIRYGSTVPARPANISSFETTAEGGQTLFSIPFEYVPGTGSITVHINGVRLHPDEVAETSETSVTLQTPAAAGDRVLLSVITEVAAGGGGSFDAPLGGVTASGVTFSESSPTRYLIPDTNPQGWNAGVGAQTLQFDFISNGYFAANPSGHLAVILRCDTEVIETAARGQGMIIGTVVGAQEAPAYGPTTQIETFYNGLPAPETARYLFPGSEGLSSRLLQDGVLYRVRVSATKAEDGQRYIRYRLYRRNELHHAWDLERDTGDVHDANSWADLVTKTGVAFGHVFNDDLSPWSLEISNVQIVWGRAQGVGTQVDASAPSGSAFDGNLDANLTMLGSSRRMLVESNQAPLASNFALQSRNANMATRIYAIPNGTAKEASLAVSNDSAMVAGNYLSVGVTETAAQLDSGNYGAVPYLPLNILAGGEVRMRFVGSSIELPGNARALEVQTSTGAGARFRIRDNQVDSATSVAITPNGSGTAANVLASNSSDLENCSFVTLGMAGAAAVLETFQVGTGLIRPLSVRIGGNQIVEFRTDLETRFAGNVRIKSSAVPIGAPSGWDMPTGTQYRHTFNADSEPAANFTEHAAYIKGTMRFLAALVHDLRARGII